MLPVRMVLVLLPGSPANTPSNISGRLHKRYWVGMVKTKLKPENIPDKIDPWKESLLRLAGRVEDLEQQLQSLLRARYGPKTKAIAPKRVLSSRVIRMDDTPVKCRMASWRRKLLSARRTGSCW